MNKHRIKRTCTKAASCLLAAMISVSAFSGMAMADELPETIQTESTVEYISQSEDRFMENLVFEDSIVLEDAEETAPVTEELAAAAGETKAAEEETPAQEAPEAAAEAETENRSNETVTEKTTAEQETAAELEQETTAEEALRENGAEDSAEMESEESEKETDTPEDETAESSEKAEPKDVYGLKNFDPAALAGIDFSSMRLIIATADDSIFVEDESIIGSFGDIYLLQFEDIETVMKAYAYYQDKADIVDVDTGIQICEGEAAEEVTTGTVMTEEENPLSELKEAITEGTASYDIALIDTGAAGNNISGAVSMIGDDPSDDNGHGTKMAEYITAENENVSILSIKALGSDGKGDISAVYAAIEYAISQKVKVINLSASAFASSGNLILRGAVRDAVNAGIIFVGSAGNNGKNVQYYVPGNIDEAFIIGAADENGVKLDISNYGETVDYTGR